MSWGGVVLMEVSSVFGPLGFRESRRREPKTCGIRTEVRVVLLRLGE